MTGCCAPYIERLLGREKGTGTYQDAIRRLLDLDIQQAELDGLRPRPRPRRSQRLFHDRRHDRLPRPDRRTACPFDEAAHAFDALFLRYSVGIEDGAFERVDIGCVRSESGIVFGDSRAEGLSSSSALSASIMMRTHLDELFISRYSCFPVLCFVMRGRAADQSEREPTL